ncbi:G-protein coupled receptors family 3 profile domain-containing protein [Plasmodiophora brassicae]|uniref:G-protein coupled receptors family 3 profile domain-containing protein n=1 Tax=Plasmodiophora brassicae TaxID=37360 RepID=A0A0G4ISF3_PLABS|nr:hypothetical protein PBRA_006284 [Plasmodiophora brassicae]SPQ95263.1 unnamed protein product [Plasmodiophora brassicae]
MPTTIVLLLLGAFALAAGSPVITCDSDPCAYAGYTCCPTYPCTPSLPTVDLAVILDFGADAFVPAVRLAVDAINADSSVLPGRTARVRWQSSRGSQVSATTAMFCTVLGRNMSVLEPSPVQAVIGPSSSLDAIALGFWLAQMDVPILSPTATDPSLSAATYPTFSRIIPGIDVQAMALARVASTFAWSQVVVISSSDPDGAAQLASFVTSCAKLHLNINATVTFDPATHPVEQLVKLQSTGRRIIVALVSSAARGNLFTAAASAGMTGPQYAWIGTDGWVGATDTDAIPEGAVGVVAFTDATSPQFVALQHAWSSAHAASAANTWGLASPSIPLIYTYDSVVMAFTALHNLQQAGKAWTPASVLSAIRQTTMVGATGRVALSALTGNRIALYTIVNRRRDAVTGQLVWQAIGTVDQSQANFSDAVDWGFTRAQTVPVAIARQTSRPLQASSSSQTAVLVMSGVVFAVVLAAMALNAKYRTTVLFQGSAPAVNDIICVACLLACVFAVLMAVPSSGSVCQARVATCCLALSLAASAYIAKLTRLVRIVIRESGTIDSDAMPPWQMFVVIGVAPVVDLIVLAVWFASDPIVIADVTLPSRIDPLDPFSSVLTPYVTTCTSKQMPTVTTLLVVYKALLFLAGVFLAVKTSDDDVPEVNDAKQIGVCVYSTTLLTALIAVIANNIPNEQADARMLTTAMLTLFSVVSAVLALFAHKAIAVYHGNTGTNIVLALSVYKKKSGTAPGHTDTTNTVKATGTDGTGEALDAGGHKL